MVLFLSVATDAGCWMPVQIKIDPYWFLNWVLLFSHWQSDVPWDDLVHILKLSMRSARLDRQISFVDLFALAFSAGRTSGDGYLDLHLTHREQLTGYTVLTEAAKLSTFQYAALLILRSESLTQFAVLSQSCRRPKLSKLSFYIVLFLVGKRLYLSRTPLTRPYFALCSSNPKARADHAFQEQHRPKEYSVAVEFKPRANCGGFTWLGSAVFGVSMCITQAGQNSNFLTRNTFDVSTHVIIISLFGLFGHLSRFSPSLCRAADWIASWQMCSKLGSGPRTSQAYSIGWPIIGQSLVSLPEMLKVWI